MRILSGLSILVVDDEPDIRDILVDEFSHLGAFAVGAGDGQEALRLLQGLRFQIVFSDVRMPGLSGLELARCIAEGAAPRPAVFLSTGYTELRLSDPQAIGVVRIFPKPLDLQEVVDAFVALAGDSPGRSG